MDIVYIDRVVYIYFFFISTLVMMRPMSTSIIEILHDSRELVSLSGRRGVSWSYMAEVLSLDDRLQRCILRYLSSRGYTITDNSNGESSNITIVAPSSEIWSFLGIMSYLDVPPDPGMELLEIVGAARANGVVLGEATSLMHTKLYLHPIIDKLCNAGLILKRLISPLSHGTSPRVTTRTTIMHLTRYAELYDPILDGVYLSVDDNQNEIFQHTILQHMRTGRVRDMSLQDLLHPLGFPSVRVLRRRLEACLSQLKGDAKLQIVSKVPRGIASSGPKAYVVRTCPDTVDEPGEDTDTSATLPGHAIFHMPVIEQAIFRLQSCKGPFPSTLLRAVVDLSVKRAAWVVSTLVKEYAYSTVLVQIRKQKVVCLQTAVPFPYAMDTVDALMDVLGCGPLDEAPPPDCLAEEGAVEGIVTPQRQSRRDVVDKGGGGGGSGGGDLMDLYALRRQVLIDCMEEVRGGGGEWGGLCVYVTVCICVYNYLCV